MSLYHLRKYGPLALLSGLLILSACNNPSMPGSEKPQTDTGLKAGPTTPVNDTSLQALDHRALIQYLPVKPEGYKAIGYPDINDKYDGMATGETRSPMATPKYVSFAKHQYEKGKTRAEVSIIDFLPGKSEYEGFKRLYLGLEKRTETQLMYRASLTLPSTEAAYNLFPPENKGELHLFVCDRFLVDIRVVETKEAEKELKKILASVRIADLVKDHCTIPSK